MNYIGFWKLVILIFIIIEKINYVIIEVYFKIENF